MPPPALCRLRSTSTPQALCRCGFFRVKDKSKLNLLPVQCLLFTLLHYLLASCAAVTYTEQGCRCGSGASSALPRRNPANLSCKADSPHLATRVLVMRDARPRGLAGLALSRCMENASIVRCFSSSAGVSSRDEMRVEQVAQLHVHVVSAAKPSLAAAGKLMSFSIEFLTRSRPAVNLRTHCDSAADRSTIGATAPSSQLPRPAPRARKQGA